ncbi:MAG: glutathione S-transferase N-terminal domain-containing protein [Bacteriovorax sp.]
MKLYHYVHCPFCNRVRIGLGLLGISYESVPLAFDDEETPKKLTGVKMLPIVVYDNGVAQNESLDILKSLDATNQLNWEALEKNRDEIDSLLNRIAAPVHNLCMPYWIWTPEFNEKSRAYFQSKKELKRGPFKDLIKNKKIHLDALNEILNNEIEKNLTPYYKSPTLTIVDIMIAAHLWGMYIFPEFQFSEKVHAYLQGIKNAAHFDYHQDFWK